jgi:two-component system, NarL family, sensor kinase
MKKNLLLIFTLFAYCITQAQTAEIDSLKSILKTTKHDTLKMRAYIDLADNFSRINPKLTLSYADTALSIARKHQYKIGIADAEMQKVVVYSMTGKYNTADSILNKCLLTYKKLNNISGEKNCYNNLSALAYYQSDYGLAIENAKKALTLSQQMKDEESVGKIYTNIGSFFQRYGKLDSSITYFTKSAEIFLEINHLNGLRGAYLNLGNVLLENNNREAAEMYLKKSLHISKEINDTRGKTLALSALADFHLQQNEYKTAQDYAYKALKIDSLNNDIFGIATNLNILANCDKYLRNFTEARKNYNNSLSLFQQIGDRHSIQNIHYNLADMYAMQNNHKKAVEQGEIAFKSATKLSELHSQYRGSQLLANSYAELNDFKNAYYYQKKAKVLYDSLFNIDKQKEIETLTIRFNTAEKELMIEKQDKLLAVNDIELLKERQMNNYLIGSIGGIFIVIISSSILIRRKNDEKRKKIQLQAKLEGQEAERNRIAQELHDGVAAQLTGIAYLAQSPRDEDLTKLSNHIHTLNKEIRLLARDLYNPLVQPDEFPSAVRTYIDVLAGNNGLNIEFYHNGIDFTKIHLETLIAFFRIIQEALHNARKHAQAANIWVQLQKDNNSLTLTVEDDGKGFKPDSIVAGTGLKSLRARAQSIGARFTIVSQTAKGTLLTVAANITKQIKQT